jgi:hypothetical protein
VLDLPIRRGGCLLDPQPPGVRESSRAAKRRGRNRQIPGTKGSVLPSQAVYKNDQGSSHPQPPGRRAPESCLFSAPQRLRTRPFPRPKEGNASRGAAENAESPNPFFSAPRRLRLRFFRVPAVNRPTPVQQRMSHPQPQRGCAIKPGVVRVAAPRVQATSRSLPRKGLCRRSGLAQHPANVTARI